jgi:hypothetical protein
MPTVTKGASSNAVVTTGWTNPTNAQAATGDNVYATAAPAKNATVSSDFGFSFSLADFVGATSAADVVIDQVVCTCEWKVSTTTVATLGVQLRNGATALGTETTFSSTTESDSTQTVTSGVTAADLIAGSLKARVRDTRGNSTTAHTGSLDFVKVDVTYHVVVTFTDSGSGAAVSVGGKTESAAYADTRSGTATASGAAAESYTPGAVTHTDTASGLATAVGARSESFAHSASASGTATATGGFSGALVYSDAAHGVAAAHGTTSESFSGPTGYTDVAHGFATAVGTARESSTGTALLRIGDVAPSIARGIAVSIAPAITRV